MSFSFDYDINASQQDHHHDDSGIGLLDDGLETKFSTHMQQGMKPQFSHSATTQLPTGVN
jgi:regulatory factor X